MWLSPLGMLREIWQREKIRFLSFAVQSLRRVRNGAKGKLNQLSTPHSILESGGAMGGSGNLVLKAHTGSFFSILSRPRARRCRALFFGGVQPSAAYRLYPVRKSNPRFTCSNHLRKLQKGGTSSLCLALETPPSGGRGEERQRRSLCPAVQPDAMLALPKGQVLFHSRSVDYLAAGVAIAGSHLSQSSCSHALFLCHSHAGIDKRKCCAL